MADSKRTTDHDTIREWAEEHGARPAHVASTGDGDDLGMLRLDFGENDEELEEVEWDDWLDAFDENDLALLYQEEPEGDHEHPFKKLVSR